jgi:hypothetical protein
MVGWAVSVLPNEYINVTQGAPLRETLTDIVVDSGGYIFSTAAGAGGAVVVGGVTAFGTGGHIEAAAGAAVVGDITFSAGASLLWDLWVAPNYVHPFIYQVLPNWAQ